MRETKETAQNGFYEVYVNAKGKDDSNVTKLMQYFLNTVGENIHFPRLSERVNYFKMDKEGVINMTSVVEEIIERGKAEGIAENKCEIIRTMLNNGIQPSEISRLTGIPLKEIEQLLSLTK